MLPPFVIDTVAGFHILRDDLIEGGTKRRALFHVLQNTQADNIGYAGTVMGHGALALANAAKDTGKTAHIFIGTDQADHPALAKLHAAGAMLHTQPPMPVNDLYTLAKGWEANEDGRAIFPPAFDCPAFRESFKTVLKEFDPAPYSEIWTLCVSGTLTRALQAALPEMPFKTVKAARAACDLGTAQTYDAPEKYHQPARLPPPYPSCPYTDAKLWQFVQKHASPNALVWNVAGR